ncbi:hypothetical protein FSP39_021068 [Pinctada imbricata]|uniref:B box-type domain-containing protein n=1 Tax=Pinctada imbricata TaxID=66713 RepID=A0AA88YF15_PINIB|nr:hypothetical protein FSP39_021068 [Pinctada imbricata]
MAWSCDMVVADKMCDEHCDELLDMFCRDCGKAICEACIKLYHLDHDWCKLSKLISEFHGHAAEKAVLIRENQIFGLRRNLTTILTLKNENAQKNFEDISGIIKKKERIIDAVNQISDRLIKKCEKDYTRIDEKLREYENDLLRRLQDCEDIAHAYEKSSDLISGYQFILMEQRLKSHNSFIPPMDFSKERDLANFVNCSLDYDKVEQMFGKVEKKDNSILPTKTVNVQQARQGSDKRMLYTMFPLADNQAWSNVQNVKQNMLITNLMNLLELTDACVDADCVSFVSLDNGDQIFVRMLDMRVCKMGADGVLNELRSTYPLSPTGVSRGAESGILVSLLDKGLPVSVPPTGGALLHLSEDGALLRKYDVDIEKTRFFPYPFKVVQNNNLDLCVVDYLRNDQTQLRVLTYDGEFKFEYNGRNLGKKLDISGICCDNRCRIILSDCRNHVVHLVNSEGVFLRFLLSRVDGMEYPLTPVIYRNTLWVHCAFGKTKVLKYEKDVNNFQHQ